MSEHLATVQHERAKYPAPKYDAEGNLVNPLGATSAFAITNATAYIWRSEGWGLLAKTSGTNHNGYSIDVLVNARDHEAVDCLGSSETLGTPQWGYMTWEDRFVELWRPPLPPDDGPDPPDPPDPPIPTDLEARVARLEAITAAQGERIHTIEAALKTVGAAMP